MHVYNVDIYYKCYIAGNIHRTMTEPTIFSSTQVGTLNYYHKKSSNS